MAVAGGVRARTPRWSFRVFLGVLLLSLLSGCDAHIWLFLEVTDCETGDPLEGVEVVVVKAGEGAQERLPGAKEAYTDGEGEAEVRVMHTLPKPVVFDLLLVQNGKVVLRSHIGRGKSEKNIALCVGGLGAE